MLANLTAFSTMWHCDDCDVEWVDQIGICWLCRQSGERGLSQTFRTTPPPVPNEQTAS